MTTHPMGFDIMSIIDLDDRALLENRRIQGMKVIDWGKSMAVSNQYISKNILTHLLGDEFRVFTSDDADLPADINTANNSPGYDIVIQTQENTYKTVQCKLRQVHGVEDHSQQTHFETTRRNSKKNEGRNHTGHVCYASDEFDFVMVSLVNVSKDLDRRNDCNCWSFAFIPIHDIIDTTNNCCMSAIPAKILKKNLITENGIIHHFHKEN
jgi:hypothetical protein